MILDTSALVSIIFKEPGFEGLLEKLGLAKEIGIGTPTLLETGIVLAARLRFDPRALLGRVIQQFGAIEIPFGSEHWQEAIGAYQRFGKGRHPAALNFGDCMSYATAKLAGQPLLYTGKDFLKTDLESA
jgi:ribonuclease VapC